MTFRLNRRRADSIDSLLFTVTDAIYFLTSFSAKGAAGKLPEVALYAKSKQVFKRVSAQKSKFKGRISYFGFAGSGFSGSFKSCPL